MIHCLAQLFIRLDQIGHNLGLLLVLHLPLELVHHALLLLLLLRVPLNGVHAPLLNFLQLFLPQQIVLNSLFICHSLGNSVLPALILYLFFDSDSFFLFSFLKNLNISLQFELSVVQNFVKSRLLLLFFDFSL